MVEVIEPDAWDLAALRDAYRRAVPFPHVVIDDFADPAFVPSLLAAFDEEPAHVLQDEIFDVMASSGLPSHPVLRAVHERLRSDVVLDAVRTITAEPVTGVEMRAYAYLPGHYLLPHADRDDGGRRRVAFAYYVGLLEGLVGGELDLYACTVDDGEIVKTTVTNTITPRLNRCVLFGVHDRSVHRVREVTAGGRLSIAGWFVA